MKLSSTLCILFCAALFLNGCTSYKYPSQVTIGESIISFEGQSLDGITYILPTAFTGEKTLLLFGYIHKSQFDIDRWLIGLDQVKAPVRVYEIPAIQGFIPRLFYKRFDDSMREGIPREIWANIITVYEDSDKVQRFTGNLSPKNARVLLIDENLNVLHFYDRGFSVAALNEISSKLQ